MESADYLKFDSEDFPDDTSETCTDEELALSDEEEADVSINLSSIDVNNDGLVVENLIILNRLLKKARGLVSMIQKSSNILRHTRAKRRTKNLND